MMESAFNGKSFFVVPLLKSMEEQNMNNLRRYLAGVAGILLICMLTINAASAYDTNIACSSLKDVIAKSGDLTAIELFAEYSDSSITAMKIWTENVIGPEESLCTSLNRWIEKGDKEKDIPRIILTTISSKDRVSYELSSDKSVFIKLQEPVAFPVLSSKIEIKLSSLVNIVNGVKYNYELNHDYDCTPNGYSISYWSGSDTNPATTLPVMTAETWIKKWNGLRWVDSCYTGDTDFYTDEVYASGGPVTLQTGTYKQFANFEGYHIDYTWYEEYHDEDDSFSIPYP
jgi:hypothetical protein